MVWRFFATKLETAETMEGVALNMRAPYFYPTSTQFEEFKESGAFYEDRDVVVGENLVSFREEAFAPLHFNVYVS